MYLHGDDHQDTDEFCRWVTLALLYQLNFNIIQYHINIVVALSKKVFMMFLCIFSNFPAPHYVQKRSQCSSIHKHYFGPARPVSLRATEVCCWIISSLREKIRKKKT